MKLKFIGIILAVGLLGVLLIGKRGDDELRWRIEGEKWAEKHLEHLKGIESVRDLKRVKSNIQQDYDELATLIVRVRKEGKEELKCFSLQGIALQKEIERVAQIEGCQKYLEQWHKTALAKIAREIRQGTRALSIGEEKKDSNPSLRASKKE